MKLTTTTTTTPVASLIVSAVFIITTILSCCVVVSTGFFIKHSPPSPISSSFTTTTSLVPLMKTSSKKKQLLSVLLSSSSLVSSRSRSIRNQSGSGSILKATFTELPEFENRESYIEYITATGALPRGFAVGCATGTFEPVEAPSMGRLPIGVTVASLTNPGGSGGGTSTTGSTESWAACFTKNKFPGSPVMIGRSRLNDGGPLSALVINNKISNVCAGGNGIQDAEDVCASVAKHLGISNSCSDDNGMGQEMVLPSSTGIIGWRIPVKEISDVLVPKAVSSMQSETAVGMAEAIMTTDRYPKLRSVTLSNGARVVGVAKGAGMIEPNMATMLSYIFTDFAVPKATLQTILTNAVDQSFNSISVDGSESTSDTVVALSSNMIKSEKNDDNNNKDLLLNEFEKALLDISMGLASDIVRNGEGTSHVMRIDIRNYPGTDQEARNLGRSIANSALLKCAIAGNDPNTGRLASAIGSFLGKIDDDSSDTASKTKCLTLTLGGRIIFENGKFVLEGDEVEDELSQHMKNAQLGEKDDFPRHQRFVEIGVDFGSSNGGMDEQCGNAIVLGSDLTAEYVAVNADYRS